MVWKESHFVNARCLNKDRRKKKKKPVITNGSALLPTCRYSPHLIIYVQCDADDKLCTKNSTVTMRKENNLNRLTLANDHFNAEKRKENEEVIAGMICCCECMVV